MIKFSIITPSLNQGKFIQDCIDSVKAQVGVECEHLVIDAGSTDETLAILRNQEGTKWISENDAGMSDGINKGFRMASGEWVMWLNCDDFLLPNALKIVADFIGNHPDVDVVHGDCLFVNEDRLLIRRKFDHPVTKPLLAFVGCYIPSTSTLIHSRVIKSDHLLDIQYRVCMDWEYYLRLLREGFRFGYIPEALAGFRWHTTNTSLLQISRRTTETLQLQREHLALEGYPAFMGNRWILHVMRRLFQVIRVAKRLLIHKRFF